MGLIGFIGFIGLRVQDPVFCAQRKSTEERCSCKSVRCWGFGGHDRSLGPWCIGL